MIETNENQFLNITVKIWFKFYHELKVESEIKWKWWERMSKDWGSYECYNEMNASWIVILIEIWIVWLKFSCILQK